MQTARAAEATRRSGVVWVGPYDGSAAPRVVWHVWLDDAAYVVVGGQEQALPGAVPGARVVVVVRSSRGDRLLRWTAAVEQVESGSERWEQVVPVLAAARLNAPDGPAQVQRWAGGGSAVLRLVPDGEVVLDAGAGA